MNPSKFVHLHVHSEYSLLSATPRIPELVKRAQEYGMPAVALTDMGNLHGAVEFFSCAKKNGIKPLIGCDIYVAPESRLERSARGLKNASYTLVLLCESEQGYRNLCQLVTRAYVEGFYYKPRVDKELLRQYREGLIALSGSLSSEIPHLINTGQLKQARVAARELGDIFGPGNFFLELQAHHIRDQERVNRELIQMAGELKLPLVATSNVLYLDRKDAGLLEVLNCIQQQTALGETDRPGSDVQEFYFKTPQEMEETFKEAPEAILNTARIAERASFEFDVSKLHLPYFETPKGQSQKAYLRELTLKGAAKKYAKVTPPIRQRIDQELEVIGNSGYESYFLIVWDFVRFAKEKGIPVGPGRGSAAGSVVSYCLDITDIDPLRYDLIFERFLNPERVSMPDIDIDFCYARRDEVIQYVSQKYSSENVAQIITFGTMMAKGVIRDVGRVMGMPYAEVDRIAKLIPNVLNMTIHEALEQEPQLKSLVQENAQVARLVEVSQGLEGLHRHASTHAAGVVISEKPLTEHLPLFRTSDGQISTMFPMNALEEIGLLKMDFLGLRTLTVIDDTIKIIKRTRKTDLDLTRIALDDRETFAELSKAQSIGVFQLESSGMRDILRKLKPDKFEDLIAVLALFRPGPIGSGMVDDFIKRKNGDHKIAYDHPLVEPVLKDTYGIIVYQEQIMKIANVLAGFSLAQADSLRRAISKKKPEIIEAEKKHFVEGCRTKKIDPKLADKIFQLIMYFAGYGFNKSHSAAYAMISYRTAYLKTHYPVEFMTAVLSSEKDNTDKVVQYIDESKRMGIEVLPPDVNESFPRFTVVGDRAIRFGLAAVKNVGQGTIDSIIQARIRHGRFKNFFDFVRQIDSKTVNRKTVECLIKCGAFDSLGCRRSQLFSVIDQAINNASEVQKDRQAGQMSLFDTFEKDNGFQKSFQDIPDVPEWAEHEKLGYEKELLGFYVTGHPLERHKGVFRKYGDMNSVTIHQKADGDQALVGALVNKLRLTTTKKTGERMAILVLEDLDGLIETLVFPRAFKDFGEMLAPNAILFFKGRVNKREDEPKLIVDEIYTLDSIQKQMTRSVIIDFKADTASEDTFVRVQEVLSRYNGETPVYLHIIDPAGISNDVLVDRTLFVRPTEELVSSVESVLGPGHIHLQV